MNLRTIAWVNNKIRIIDQTKLPNKLEYLDIRDVKTLWMAIKELKVRGAPALGAAAALGVYLSIKDYKGNNLLRELERSVKFIGSSRPTARNLFWGLERVRKAALDSRQESAAEIKSRILKEARSVIEEDRAACRRMGRFGSGLIKDGDTILTVCNAGILATIDYGTALGVIYAARAAGKRIKVYACESRPLLQGARLTAWELKKNKIDVTLICDNMAASVMKAGKIDKVITGADRIAANGDTANKIGTYNLAVLSKYHRIPFYVAAPRSTFDLSMRSGKQIIIEERSPKEVTELIFKKRVAPSGVKVFNPAFDVTDSRLISGFITEKGLIMAPYEKNIAKVLGR